jgi:PadR family transcriptional regulator PadR
MATGDPERLKGHLDLLLLSVLARGPAHGYAVIAALRQRSAGAFDLPEGTVYPALHRLERAGLLGAHWERGGAGPGAGRRRKVYALTDEGEAALTGERTQWQRFRTGVGAVLQTGGTTA